MSDRKCVKIGTQEAWYGLCVEDGPDLPITSTSTFCRKLTPNESVNGAAGILVSSDGRYLYCAGGVQVSAQNGFLEMCSPDAQVVFEEGHGTLRGAWTALVRDRLPAGHAIPPALFFTAPQYNTWIELLYEQTQAGILAYARALLANGYPPGVLMIDDGWMRDYGTWEFVPERFPDPREMVDQLHAMGFRVMLWVSPFVSPDSPVFRDLRDTNVLLRDAQGEIAVREWWNGYSAVLDLSGEEGVNWLHGRLDSLMEQYGVDGFKMDAGDAKFYRDDDRSAGNVTANEQSTLWAKAGLHYAYNEFRACYAMANAPLVQRLADKNHSWDRYGVGSLVANTLTQGMLGYPFSCPDMIGGGAYINFIENSKTLDLELFVRYAQCAALMPMMQFSAAPWRVLPPEENALCLKAAKLHGEYAELILKLAKHAAETGEPIVRYMEYCFPHQGMQSVCDQFMLGDALLAAPVLAKGVRQRDVVLPAGRWKYVDGTVYDGGRTVTVPAGLDTLPYFILQS
ncbi:MAG: glycoside hydrolase [Subdoligranulum sp.]|nr:glycoside hydrolase [Subdoligranulum sp.]